LIGVAVIIVGEARIYNATGPSFALPGSSAPMTGSFGLTSRPPALSSAAFNGAFTSLVLQFSQDTDQGSNALLSVTAPPCTRLIEPDTLSLLGANPVCQWLTLSRLEVVLGSGAVIAPGLRVALLPNWLKSADLTSAAASSSAQLSTVVSAVAVAPPVEISAMGARVLGNCAPLQLDLSASSGLGGRPGSVRWRLVGAEPAATAPPLTPRSLEALQSALDAQSAPNSLSLQLVLPASMIPLGKCLLRSCCCVAGV
jgi:hypothetical protein